MFDYMAHTESYDMDVTSYIWRCIDMQWRNVIFCIFINWVIRRERKKTFFLLHSPICNGFYLHGKICVLWFDNVWILWDRVNIKRIDIPVLYIYTVPIVKHGNYCENIILMYIAALWVMCVCECWMIILWYNGKTLWCHASYNNNGITIIIEMCFTFYNTEFWFKFIKWFLFHILYTFRNTIIKKNAII